MISSLRATNTSTTFPEERLALTQKRPNYQPTGTHSSLRSASTSSFHSIIGDGKYRNTALSRNAWKKLIGLQSSPQTNCNKEGFNTAGSSKGYCKARVGILGNNKKDCANTDSLIGFGMGGYQDDPISCGNYAIKGYTSDNGEKHIKAMGYILVQ